MLLTNSFEFEKMLNNLLKKISTQLLLSYLVPLMGFGLLGISAYTSARRTFVIEVKRDKLNASNHAANDAAYYLMDSIRKAKGNIITPNESRYNKVYADSRNLFLESIAQLKELAEKQKDPELEALALSLESEGERINRVVRKTFVEIARRDEAAAIALTQDLEADSVGENRQQLVDYLTQQLANNTAEFELAQRQLGRTLIWGTVFAGIVSLGTAVLLVKQIRDQMDKMVGVVEKNGIQVTTSSTQIAASSRQLEATVSEQAASTTQIAATATEIAATSEELSQTMSQVVELSESAAMTATAGRADLSNMADTIQQLIVSTSTISSKLGLIDDKANNISAVVMAITKVADQTNLLSLNAAIEAEKAGEYGAGFSVVAREIRRLADQTAIATLDIENMVQEMLSSVSAGVMEMDKFTQDVNNNAQSIGQISEQMAQIINQVQSLVPEFETVNDGMLAQSASAHQIRAAMEQLRETSSQTTDSVKDTHQVIVQLSKVASDLQSQVARFRMAV
ncbi:MAG: methyl-accepting chemotaxis protein [Cyanobacteria bacterium J06597_16]